MEPFVLEQDTSLLRIQTWENMNKRLVAGFTTRLGGKSKEPYETFNFGLHVGDHDEDVIENRKILCEQLGFDFSSWTCAEQIHGNHVVIVEKGDSGRGRLSHQDTIEAADGIITQEQDVLLTSFYADCVPLLFFVPGREIVGIAHAGWKGTAANIAQQMVDAMGKRFNVALPEIQVAIGPSIGSCCYEVDDRVVTAMKNTLHKTSEKYLSNSVNPGKYMIDLKKVNQLLLLQAGLRPNQISVSNWCTSCHTDLFFSYRKEAGITGRMAAFIGWRKEG